MTGFANTPRGCSCDITLRTLCPQGVQLAGLVDRGRRIAHQYGSHGDYNRAAGNLAAHVGCELHEVSLLLARPKENA